MKISEILTIKGNLLYTVTPDTTMMAAVQTMAEKDMGSLIVMETGILVGMLTFREVLNAISQNNGTVGNGMVKQFMDHQPTTATPDTSVNEVRRIMLDKHVRYLPIMEKGILLGVISFYDVAKAMLEAQNFENTMLKAYIHDFPAKN